MITDYKKNKESTKEFLKDSRKNPEIVISCLIIGGLFVFAIYNFFVMPSLNEKFQANIGQQVIQMNPSISEEGSKPCEEGMFAENLDNWTIKYYEKPDKDSFYCPRSSKDFLYRIIWYKNPISTNFESLELNYQLKNKDSKTKDPPSFIFAIEENPDILRFYAPQQKNDQLVGFEKITKDESQSTSSDAGFLMKWEEGKTLDERIAYWTEAALKVQVTIIGGNKAVFSFTLNYISAIDGRSAENGFSYEVNLPKPSPESELSKLKIGFGTFIENCVKPISYKFCY